MSEADSARPELAALRQENLQLRTQLDDARQALDALALGQVDAVLRDGSATPLLLEAAQERLLRSQELLRAVFDSSLDALVLDDDHGVHVDVNAAACALFGLPREQLLGRRMSQSATPLSVQDEPRAKSYPPRQGEHYLLSRPNVSFRVLDVRSVLDVAPGLHLLAMRDITDQIAAQHALLESEQRYRRLIEELPEPVLVHVDGAIAFANAASGRALGVVSAQELIGRSLLEFATETTRTEVDTLAASAVPDAALVLGEQSFARASDGVVLHATVESIPIVFDGRAAMLSIVSDVTPRVEAEREAASSLRDAYLERRKLEAVLEALPVGVWIADPAGALTHTNPAAARIWGGQAPLPGAASEWGVYKGFSPLTGDLLRPEDWALSRSLATGETVVAEASTIERFDGTHGHVLNSAAAVRDDEGRIVGGVAVMLDVTSAHEAAQERERLIASLEFERGRLGMLLAKAPAFIAVMRGKQHVFELVNDAYRELIGGRDVLGKSVADALEEVREQGFVQVLDKVLASGEAFIANGMPVMLSRGSSATLERRYVNFVYQPLLESDGTISGVFLHGVDVTDATVAEQRVRAQFHGVPVPTYVWQRVETATKKQFVLADYNQAALAFSQGSIAAHLGKSADSFFHDALDAIVDMERCLDLGTTHAREVDWKMRSTGETRRLYVTYAAAPPDLVIVHAADVTERVMLEQQLRQAQKMEAVGRLAGGVAHDFNNLLSVILSYADLSIEGLRASDPLRKDLEQIQRAGVRATDLTRQLLAFSRQQVLDPRVIDLEKIIAGMTPMLGRLLGEDVQLSVLVSPTVGLVLADPGQVEQVVMNLAVNARDAMPEGGKLSLETADVVVEAGKLGKPDSVPAGAFVMLAMTDSGIGMDQTTLNRVFEPFFTTKDVGKGTGLGLSTVFGIVHQSGGFITVASELSKGTTFQVYLPRTERKSPSIRVHASMPTALRGNELILLVEDEEQVRGVGSAILRRAGYRVIEASNGGEALLAAQEWQGKVDLLLTDVVMPRMSGRKLAEQLAPSQRQMKVLFASGYTDDVVLKHGVLDDEMAFLQKPFTRETLLSKVREVLDER